MKNKIFGSIAVLAIACLAVINISVNSNLKNSSILSIITLSDTEALSGEWGGWSNFWQGQGFWLDEREWTRVCPKLYIYRLLNYFLRDAYFIHKNKHLLFRYSLNLKRKNYE